MDDSIRAAAPGPADDIIARIMSEIEDVIGLIQTSPVAPRPPSSSLAPPVETETAIRIADQGSAR